MATLLIDFFRSRNRLAYLFKKRHPEMPPHAVGGFLSGRLLVTCGGGMGENLFLSAYRFYKPLSTSTGPPCPMVLILLAVVLLITYLPIVTLGPIELLLR